MVLRRVSPPPVGIRHEKKSPLLFLRMALDLMHAIGVPFNREIEAPSVVHARLPDISANAVLLRPE
jgi:hypothetical protein